jgi:hypothetical protein
MATRRKLSPLKVRRATAYRRLAAKARRAGAWHDVERYDRLADRLMSEHRREVEDRAARAAANAAWRARGGA